jgi:hypothetical protein
MHSRSSRWEIADEGGVGLEAEGEEEGVEANMTNCSGSVWASRRSEAKGLGGV